MRTSHIIRGLVVGGLLVLGLIVLLSSIRVVNPGTVKVVTRTGRVTGRVLSPGMYVITPFIDTTLTYNTKKVIYETSDEEKQKNSQADYKDYPVDTNTKDGQQVNIYYTVRFSVDPTQVTRVANAIGDENALVEKIVKADSRIWVRNIPREFEAEYLYTGNVQDVQLKIEEKLNPLFEENGLLLDEVGIREIKFASDYVEAIESKQIEAVKVQTEKNKADQAKYQKEARITQAEGAAREQELQRSTISQELLQKLYLEKWDGKLPQIVTGDQGMLFNMSLPNK